MAYAVGLIIVRENEEKQMYKFDNYLEATKYIDYNNNAVKDVAEKLRTEISSSLTRSIVI